jgi:hypothetical protein
MSNSFKSARSAVGFAGALDSRRERRARCPSHNAESEHRELARRSSAGVDVTLYWHPLLDELTVCVCDERHGTTHFEIRPPRHLALEVYYHPYAYADLDHVYEKENRRAA